MFGCWTLLIPTHWNPIDLTSIVDKIIGSFRSNKWKLFRKFYSFSVFHSLFIRKANLKKNVLNSLWFNTLRFRINVSHVLTFQLNILPLTWSRDGPLFFSSLVKGIQFQSQLTVSRYPTSKCQINIKKGWSKCGVKGFTVNKFYPSHLGEFPRVQKNKTENSQYSWSRFPWMTKSSSPFLLIVLAFLITCCHVVTLEAE